MSKTSALQQIPYLLGSPYISVFYNLQQPGLYANTATFLNAIATGIYRSINARGLAITNLSYDTLHIQPNDAHIYHHFEDWLATVAAILDREQRTLLLTIDEFEILEETEQSKYLDVNSLLNWMRSIIQFHPRITFLFSGVKTFQETIQESVLVSHYIEV